MKEWTGFLFVSGGTKEEKSASASFLNGFQAGRTECRKYAVHASSPANPIRDIKFKKTITFADQTEKLKPFPQHLMFCCHVTAE